MTREMWVWTGLALASLAWCVLSASSGGALVIPALIAALAVTGAVNDGARERMSRWLRRALSGPAWRTVLIVVGALMLIQLLPFELALLMAGDVLTYVEVVAAVSMITANTRLRPLLATAAIRVRRVADRLRPRVVARQARAPRPVRRKAPAKDADGPGWAFA